MKGDIKFCGLCGQPAHAKKDKTCSNCHQPYEGVSAFHWFRQEMNVTDRPGVAAEMDELDNQKVKASGIGGKELGKALRTFIILLLIGAVLITLGALTSKLPGTSFDMGNYRVTVKSNLPVLMIVVGAALVVLAFILLFRKLFAKVRAKTPEQALRMYWNAALKPDSFGLVPSYENKDSAASKLLRGLPVPVRAKYDAAAIADWIDKLRDEVNRCNRELQSAAVHDLSRDLYDATEAGFQTELTNLRVTKGAEDHQAVAEADVTVARKMTRKADRNRVTFYFVSATVLHVRVTALRAGRFWYLPDLTPAVETGPRYCGRGRVGEHLCEPLLVEPEAPKQDEPKQLEETPGQPAEA